MVTNLHLHLLIDFTIDINSKSLNNKRYQQKTKNLSTTKLPQTNIKQKMTNLSTKTDKLSTKTEKSLTN